jgi:hypothetical protein
MDCSQYFGFSRAHQRLWGAAKYMNGLAIGRGTFAGIRIAKRPAKTVFTTVSLGILSAAKNKEEHG